MFSWKIIPSTFLEFVFKEIFIRHILNIEILVRGQWVLFFGPICFLLIGLDFEKLVGNQC